MACADDDRKHGGGDGKFKRGRQCPPDQRERGHVVHVADAQIAADRAQHEVPVLLDQRPVEPQPCDDRRFLVLGCRRIDQDIDRVADHVDADEHDDRHDRHHLEALEKSAQNEQ
jgi:hypothetical protein